MKKIPIFAAIAAAMIAVGLVVACNKENPTTSETFAPATKSPVDQELQRHLRTIWALTDSALQANPNSVIVAAEKEDLEGFLKITGIPSSLVDEVVYLAKARVANGGELDTTYSVCSECGQFALQYFVNQCFALRVILDKIHYYDPDFEDESVITIPDRVTLCEYECGLKHRQRRLTDHGLFLCILDCHMMVAREDAERILDAIAINPVVDDLH